MEDGSTKSRASGGGKGKGVMKQPAKPKAGSFQAMGLSHELFRGIMAMGYKVPTPVQRKSLPVTLAGADVVVMARTGSGKTAAFLVPVLEKLEQHSAKIGVRSIILSPTRELAVQTLTFARKMAKYKNLRLALLVGGDSMDKQFTALADNPDIIIATPGRLMHHLQEVPEFTLGSVEVIVFDEADRLFEMGFAEQLREIMRGVPEERQSLLFSATMPKQLVQFARAGLKDPTLIRLDTESKISTELSLAFFTCRSADKPAALLFLLRELIPPDDMTIVFVATRHHAEFVHEMLKEVGILSSVVYGAMDQEARSIHLDKFRKGKTKLLVVTDVAARGIDVPLLNNVINYAFPPAPKLFVHRVGRAARQGRTGTAFNIVDPEEVPHMLDLHLFLGRPPMNTYVTNADISNSSSSISAGDGGAGRSSLPLKEGAPEGYPLADLNPDLVHYGNFPQQVMDDENESLRELLGRAASNLAGLHRVCENAMKQYRRTRPDPSGRAIRRGKELDKAETHPLLVKFEARGMHSAAAHAGRNQFLRAMSSFRPKETIFELLGGGGTEAKGDMEQVMGAVRKRARVHRLLTRNETAPTPTPTTMTTTEQPSDSGGGGSVDEEVSGTADERAGEGDGGHDGDVEEVTGADVASRTGSSLETSGMSGRSQEASDGQGSGEGSVSMGLEGEEEEEEEEEEARAPVTTGLGGVSGGDAAVGSGNGGTGGGAGGKGKGKGSSSSDRGGGFAKDNARDSSRDGSMVDSGADAGVSKRKYLSRFERKQMKKAKVRGGGGDEGSKGGHGALARLEREAEELIGDEGGGTGPLIGNGNGPGRFADKSFYIGYGTTEEASFVEAAMQPRSVEKSRDGFAAGRLEEAILDVNPDEAVDMAKKQRLLHWDSRKKKYVKTTLAELGEKGGGSRKIRTESGVVVSSKKAAHGEIYAKWKRSSNRKVGREGDEEEASLKGTVSGGGGGWGSGGGRGRRGGWGEGAGGAWGSEEITGGGEGNGKAQGDGRVVRDELRNKDQIRKAKAKDEDKLLKNMPKAKRRALLKKKQEKEDPRKQVVKNRMQIKGRTRSRMRVKM